jgi:hypothetical protein
MAIVDFFQKESELLEGLRAFYSEHSKPEREAITRLVESLGNQSFRAIYRKSQPLGFKPSFGGEGENTPKERRRMGTFIFTLLENMQMTNSRFESLFNQESPSTNEE